MYKRTTIFINSVKSVDHVFDSTMYSLKPIGNHIAHFLKRRLSFPFPIFFQRPFAHAAHFWNCFGQEQQKFLNP